MINESPSRPPRGEEMIGCFQTLGSETRDINYHKRGDVPVLCTLAIIGNGGLLQIFRGAAAWQKIRFQTMIK